MRGCARFIAFIGLVLFIFCAVSSVLLLNVRYYLLLPQTYTHVLREADVYERLPALVADQIRYGLTFNPCLEDPDLCEGEGPSEELDSSSMGGPPSYFSNLPEEVWEAVFIQLLDPVWLEGQGDAILDQVFSILTEGPSDNPIIISFAEVKQRIAGEAGYQAVLEVIQAQPECTPDQLSGLTQAIASEELSNTVLLCRPSEDVMDLVEPYVRSGLSEVSSSLPSIMEVDIPAELRTAGSGAATALAVARATFQYAPWIALFWLLWVTVFAVRDLRSWLRWWGDGLFLTGLSLLVIGFAAGPYFTWSVERMIDSRGISGFSPNVLALVLDVFNLVVDGFSQRLLVQAGIILGIGLLMLIVRLFTRRPSNGQVGTQLTEPRAEP